MKLIPHNGHSNGHLFIAACYAPPLEKSSALQEISSCVKFLQLSYLSPSILLIGDFNATEDDPSIITLKKEFGFRGLMDEENFLDIPTSLTRRVDYPLYINLALSPVHLLH